MNEKIKSLTETVPSNEKSKIDWNKIMQSELSLYFHKMSETKQNPEWHGEIDVWTHTKMVCDSLIKSKEWRELERYDQEIVFIAALLHDIGKIVVTRIENGQFVSTNHTSAGERIVRTILWKDFELCGTYESQQFRETICSLIKYHSIPFNFFDEKSPERKAITLSVKGELVPHYSNELLYILVQADILGRISSDINSRLNHLYFFREIAEEAECLKNPKIFDSSFSRYAYLTGRNIIPGQELYNDTWGTVIMMSGLPGTGKDTYIKTNYPDLPVVSLDLLRKRMNLSPTEPQGEIINAAREQAKEYLRKNQPFVWNATNVTPMIREKQIAMFTKYNAMVKIVFLETQWSEMFKRNQNRKDIVPQSAIEGMLAKLIPPDLCESHDVEWILI